jgi:type II secretory ATPase GspE/PulE/Tfp pilus assembly ATPase PilB-like protein
MMRECGRSAAIMTAMSTDTHSPSVRDRWLVPVLQRLLAPEDLARLLATCGGGLWQAAVRRRLIDDDVVLREGAAHLGIETWDGARPTASMRDAVPEQWARRFAVLPVELTETMLTIATPTPYDLDCERTLAFATGRRVRALLASPLTIARGLDELYAAASAWSAPPSADPASMESAERAADAPVEGAIIALVDTLIADGIAARASDIHLEREENAVAVRHRIDGVLRNVCTLEPETGLPLVSRIKIMAGLDIADRLRPQDGRLTVSLGAGQVDLRVSTLPAAHGEKVVLRVLDARAGGVTLDSLGLSPNALALLTRLIDAREGMILVTGPTGSGKTTTLYAALRSILGRGLNVVTVEDPVEYRLPGIVQVQVSTRTGLTFAAALRSILRQDPDVILVGEIRDAETATIAIQAALTGHLVLSTLHTIDAAGAIARLDDLGVDRYKIAASLRGVVAQRLLRRLCASCRTVDDAELGPALGRYFGETSTRWRERGCRVCGGTGYRGRLAALEVLESTSAVEQAIAHGAAAVEIEHVAHEGGMQRLWDAGVEQVEAGFTSTAELLRVLELPLPPAAEALARAAHAGRRGESVVPGRARAAERSTVRERLRALDVEVVMASIDALELTDPG